MRGKKIKCGLRRNNGALSFRWLCALHLGLCSFAWRNKKAQGKGKKHGLPAANELHRQQGVPVIDGVPLYADKADHQALSSSLS
jgi:hypothetical protein